MADTRHYDLEQLYEDRKKARNAYERDRIDQIIDKIMRESGAVRSTREKLVQAIRADDRRAIQRFQHELMMIQAEKTYGRKY